MNRCVIFQQRSMTQSMDHDPPKDILRLMSHTINSTRELSLYLLKYHSTRKRQKGDRTELENIEITRVIRHNNNPSEYFVCKQILAELEDIITILGSCDNVS